MDTTYPINQFVNANETSTQPEQLNIDILYGINPQNRIESSNFHFPNLCGPSFPFYSNLFFTPSISLPLLPPTNLRNPIAPVDNLENQTQGRRPRTIINKRQLSILEENFKKSKYLSREKRYEIMMATGLTERQVKCWFQNRRAKWRRGAISVPKIQQDNKNIPIYNPHNFNFNDSY